jgi:hypothetical protein
MRNNRFLDIVNNPNLISGIHNYCDRWCERCPFTARCAVYAAEEADPDNDPATRDINNAAFWQKLSAIFKETHELISAWAEENGVDLSPSALAEVQQQDERQWEQVEQHPLAKKAEAYAFAVNSWFTDEFQQIEEFSDTAVESTETIEGGEDVNDYIEVIRWYQFFIAVKLMRGISSQIDEDEYLDEEEQRDSDGSVKAALIAIDRSMSAWKQMLEMRPENAESIQEFLLDLEKMRLWAEGEFPGARGFIRPGFDEELDRLH